MLPRRRALRHTQIVIQARGAGQATDGQANGGWTTFAALYAAVSPLTGRARDAAMQAGSEITHQVEIDYTAGVTDKMRILIAGTRVLNINSVRNVEERNRILLLDCTEGIGKGGI